ncbi:LOW QUALITY PROTEIN: hypothetical protein CRUP_026215, partial [Coryphaenoides rupestris]
MFLAVPHKAAWRLPGQYLVVLDRQDPHASSHVQRSIRRLRARADRRGARLEVLRTFSGSFHGFLAKMSSDALHLAAKLPHVSYIEEDSSIFGQSVPWNLQRLLRPQHVAPDPGQYQPPNTGGQAEVYLMDGSVRTSHRELDGHVLSGQCESHGTHTAGVVGGVDSGVAPGAAVRLVRLLNCQGRGTVSGALAAVDYIQATLLARGGGGASVAPAVVLMPFVGGFSRTLNAACRELVAGGAVVVITVGAVTAEDQPMALGAGGTNFGRCVDLFAPGDDIVSASSVCTTCYTPRSGTSQAAAHVAGVAAVVLTSAPNATAVQVLQRMLHYAARGSVNLLSVPEPHRLATPNLLAAMPPPPTPGHTGGSFCAAPCGRRGGASTNRASVRCRGGEEMMGCSSYAPDGGRAGETVD